MRIIDVEAAKDLIARLVDEAAKGEAFIIARDGRPLVKVVPADAATTPEAAQRIGFLDGELAVPEDFDTIGRGEIKRQFNSR